jgi:hypothetical protein
MSTRSTIKYEDDPDSRQRFHLYEEAFDEEREHVYLELEGFAFEAASHAGLLDNGVNRVVLKLPQAWARKMGLLEPKA